MEVHANHRSGSDLAVNEGHLFHVNCSNDVISFYVIALSCFLSASLLSKHIALVNAFRFTDTINLLFDTKDENFVIVFAN